MACSITPAGRRAVPCRAEPHQFGAQAGGRLAEDDRAEHQLEKRLYQQRVITEIARLIVGCETS